MCTSNVVYLHRISKKKRKRHEEKYERSKIKEEEEEEEDTHLKRTTLVNSHLFVSWERIISVSTFYEHRTGLFST